MWLVYSHPFGTGRPGGWSSDLGASRRTAARWMDECSDLEKIAALESFCVTFDAAPLVNILRADSEVRRSFITTTVRDESQVTTQGRHRRVRTGDQRLPVSSNLHRKGVSPTFCRLLLIIALSFKLKHCFRKSIGIESKTEPENNFRCTVAYSSVPHIATKRHGGVERQH